MNIVVQDKMHSNIYKRVTKIYDSFEENNDEIIKQSTKLSLVISECNKEMRIALISNINK